MKPRAFRILFFSPFIHPEPISTGRYNTHLVRSLVARGCSVEVVASHPLYPRWRPTFSDETLPGVTIHRGGLHVRYPRSNLPRRMVLESWYFVHALHQARKLKHDVSAAVVVLPPMLFVPALRRLFPDLPLIGIVHDIQGIMARSADSRVRRLASVVIRSRERSAFQICDRLIALSESMRMQLIEEYGVAEEKIRLHYPFVTMPVVLPDRETLAALLPSEQINIVYAGALGEKQRPYELLQFFRELCRLRADVVCHVFSSGPIFEELQQKAAEESRIRFHGLVSDEQLPELYARSTVQIVPQASGTDAGAFPSKLPNLIASGVPLFVICDAGSELHRVVEETGIGVRAQGKSPSQWARKLATHLDELAGQNRCHSQMRMRQYVERMFNVERVTDSILECLTGAR